MFKFISSVQIYSVKCDIHRVGWIPMGSLRIFAYDATLRHDVCHMMYYEYCKKSDHQYLDCAVFVAILKDGVSLMTFFLESIMK